jgi:restriction system protein
VLGRIRKYPLTSLEIPTTELIKFLNSNQKLLDKIDPFKAEHVVAQLLSDALACEVRVLGGRKDGGVDAFVIVGNQTSTIVQVKWHQVSGKAESVKVIRELVGTLLVKGVPKGILVTTRPRLSHAAKSEAEAIGKREIVGVGKLSLDYKTYSDLLSMLEISTRKLSERPRIGADVSKYDLFDSRSR